MSATRLRSRTYTEYRPRATAHQRGLLDPVSPYPELVTDPAIKTYVANRDMEDISRRHEECARHSQGLLPIQERATRLKSLVAPCCRALRVLRSAVSKPTLWRTRLRRFYHRE